jgi:hypothetical protein
MKVAVPVALVLGMVLGVATLYFTYTMPALDAADARTRAAQANVVEAQGQLAETRDQLETAQVELEKAQVELEKARSVTATDGVKHCRGVAVGMTRAHNSLRGYFLAQERMADANGHQAAFVEWGENKNGKITDLRAVPLDRVLPDRPTLYDDVIKACEKDPERFAIPKADASSEAAVPGTGD